MDKSVLAEKMVAAYMAAGNARDNKVEITCADKDLLKILHTELRKHDFLIKPIEEASNSNIQPR